jgi:hypothetical protein
MYEFLRAGQEYDHQVFHKNAGDEYFNIDEEFIHNHSILRHKTDFFNRL